MLNRRGVQVKQEKPEEEGERDMTHYVKDRLELMKQVFTVLKEREFLAMAPPALRSLPVDQLQELCLEQVLGISSKRLCSILDGYPCPSDTDSDCPDSANIETLSLDSISSAEDELEVTLSKRKKKEKHSKHKHRGQTRAEAVASDTEKEPSVYKKHRKGRDQGAEGGSKEESGTASMTVLELLELQMRAKAIRAQLQTVQPDVCGEDAETEAEEKESERESNWENDDELEIKEIKPEVVELITSSDEEKPSTKEDKTDCSRNMAENPPLEVSSHVMDSKDNNCTSVSGKAERKIKLVRNTKLHGSVPGSGSKGGEDQSTGGSIASKQEVTALDTDISPSLPCNDLRNLLKRKKNASDTGGGSIADAIRDKPKTGNQDEELKQRNYRRHGDSNEPVIVKSKKSEEERSKSKKKSNKMKRKEKKKECDEDEIQLELSDTEKMFESSESEASDEGNNSSDGGLSCLEPSDNRGSQRVGEVPAISEEQAVNTTQEVDTYSRPIEELSVEVQEASEQPRKGEEDKLSESVSAEEERDVEVVMDTEEDGKEKCERSLSEGECSDSSDHCLRESLQGVQRAIRDVGTVRDAGEETAAACGDIVNLTEGCDDDTHWKIETGRTDSEFEGNEMVFEISDESSRDSDVGMLSKEPSREEILEMSIKLEKDMEEAKQQEAEQGGDVWKQRWLDSDKVKSVLKTSSLFNALRKKNMELRKRLRITEPQNIDTPCSQEEAGEPVQKSSEGAEQATDTRVAQKEPEEMTELSINSVDFYKTLPSGSKELTSYPSCEDNLQKMAKDAKHLMKMYKKLLKMNKEKSNGKKCPAKDGRKKKKKSKKSDK